MASDVSFPHIDSLPLPKLVEKLEVLDLLVDGSFLKPLLQSQKVYWFIINIMAESFLAYCKIFLDFIVLQRVFLILLDFRVLDFLQVVRVRSLNTLHIVLLFLQIDELLNMRRLLQNQSDVFVKWSFNLCRRDNNLSWFSFSFHSLNRFLMFYFFRSYKRLSFLLLTSISVNQHSTSQVVRLLNILLLSFFIPRSWPYLI